MSEARSSEPKKDASRLLELAAAILAQAGPEALTMEALAEAAGLSRATIYRRVGSRARLVAQLAAAGQLDAKALEALESGDVPSRVLEAMRRVLASEGFSGTTVERVAQEAGVGPATIYRRFGDREGLFAAFASRFSPRRLARDLAESGRDLDSDLRGLARESLDFFRQHPELMRLRMSGDPEAHRLLGGGTGEQERMLPMLARYFENRIEAGQLAPADPMLLATAFGGLVTGFGLMSQDASGPGLRDVDAAARMISDIFLDGARSRLEPEPSDDAGERS